MFCLFFGLDNSTIPPHLFHNKARLFMFYTVMGYHFIAEEEDNNNGADLDEEQGMITVVEDMLHHVQYNDDCNRYECQTQLLNKKKSPPPWREHTQ
jgi:hypothetical protein